VDKTLKDAVNEAIRDWVTNVGETYYLLGSALGPHPYPTIVRDFQSVIGVERASKSWIKPSIAPGLHCVCRWRLELDRLILWIFK